MGLGQALPPGGLARRWIGSHSDTLNHSPPSPLSLSTTTHYSQLITHPQLVDPRMQQPYSANAPGAQPFRPLNVKGTLPVWLVVPSARVVADCMRLTADALSYLDRVKVTFQDQPEGEWSSVGFPQDWTELTIWCECAAVYDRFLSIMKVSNPSRPRWIAFPSLWLIWLVCGRAQDFKSQGIDTPGVIERVSHLVTL